MRLPLAAVLLALALPAASAEHLCVPVEGIGCFYAPESIGRNPPLLIYLRGHYLNHRGDVPVSKALESSRQAFDFHALGETARATGHAILVTYCATLSIAEADVRRVEASSGLFFPRRVVAAHSGGYMGLGATLANGLGFERVVLPDLFYSGSPELAQRLQARFPADVCRGFYTPHNRQRFESAFRPHASGCRVETLDSDSQHNPGVNRCLADCVRGASCR